MEQVYKLDCFFKVETEQAVLVVDPLSNEEIWFPLSTVHEMVKRPDGSGYIVVDYWIAQKKQLI